MDDLPATIEDIACAKSCLSHYGITEKSAKFYELHDPSEKECNAAFKEISKTLQANSEENYLILLFLAGHGMNDSGQQILLINEFAKSTNFYKRLNVEAKVRSLAEMFPNAYFLGFFACCREIYNKERHQGFAKGQ